MTKSQHDHLKMGLRPFRRAVLRGLGVILPPLLTIVFLLWVGNSVQRYILNPLEGATKRILIGQVAEIYDSVDAAGKDARIKPDGRIMVGDQSFVKLDSGQLVPQEVFDTVQASPGDVFPTTAQALYERYVTVRWLRPAVIVPVTISLLVLTLYLLGKFMAARIGRVLWSQFEYIINRLPFIRAIYGTVKQVTDILFGDREIEYTRVVAVEYPRKGLWSIGFVTGESMSPIRAAAQEPVLSVLMPTSPMPATGFTITVRKSETIELDLSVDQALQFVVSCGVVVPGQDSTPLGIQQDFHEAIQAHPREPAEPPLESSSTTESAS